MPSNLVDYEDDKRQENPGSDRQGAFKRGWGAAVKGEEDSSRYNTDAELTNLTWDNLGYRLGRLFGPTSDDLKQELFEWCAAHQKENAE
ncbi:hypothetical protein SAMN05192561_104156 [Halopenitus malekzadehii]|uniref:Uncharacterized protein n=1 Tax=Halopenitus malekzadehii TaxID=1267564 RepID=A0A1H6IZM1_9EURY|nr:hypothetical protein [Halopenitus malekzadehii]SEH52586.1 hypothetical protein SAMN05192561_104156 [Halopenitus malekzadehii]